VRIGNYEGNQLVFADKTAVNERMILRHFGYAPKGIPAIVPTQLWRTEWWSLLPAYSLDRFLDNPLIIKGAVMGELFK